MDTEKRLVVLQKLKIRSLCLHILKRNSKFLDIGMLVMLLKMKQKCINYLIQTVNKERGDGILRVLFDLCV